VVLPDEGQETALDELTDRGLDRAFLVAEQVEMRKKSTPWYGFMTRLVLSVRVDRCAQKVAKGGVAARAVGAG